MNKIRSLLLTFSLSAMVWSCGEAGFGFDVAAEVPVEVNNIVIPVPANPLGTTDNLQFSEFSFEYNLNEVDGFQDAVDELNRADSEVILRGLFYEVNGVEASNSTGYDERVPIESNRVDFVLPGGTTSLELPFSGSSLDNIGKTELNVNSVRELLESQLLLSQGLQMNFVFDAGDVPVDANAHQIDFELVIYFDVALRVRNINE